MPRWFRRAVMFLLAVALPLQGVAAATMISCAPGQHDHGSGHFRSHDHRSASSAVAEHSHAAKTSPHSHDGKRDLSKASQHKCSACASCCTGAAVPSEEVTFDTVKSTDHFAPLVARRVPAFVTEGLERPPRAFLA